jgi:hypothetical protein
MRILPYLAVVTFIAGIGMLIVGYTYSGDSKADPGPPPVFFTPTPYTPTATPTDAPTATPTPPPYNGGVARFQIPSLKVDAAVEAIGINSQNELETPTNPRNVGWYDSSTAKQYIGSKPGFGKNSVFAAHVDYYGLPPGDLPFNKLKNTSPGDAIDVVMDNGLVYHYKIIFKQRYNVSDIPMGELIDGKAGDTVEPPGVEWITMITCGNDGAFVYVDGGNSGPVEYLTRDVVIAQRVQ